MGTDSLNRSGEAPPVVNKGRDTKALGPSDSSDSGSDIAGAPGLDAEEAQGLLSGTTSDADHNRRGGRRTAGPDIGDENLDSDTDSGGTGERGAAGRDAAPPTDQMLSVIDDEGASDLVSADELSDTTPGSEDPDIDAEIDSTQATPERSTPRNRSRAAPQQHAANANRRKTSSRQRS